MQELNQIKRQLLGEVADLKDHLELEQKGKSEEAGVLHLFGLALSVLIMPFIQLLVDGYRRNFRSWKYRPQHRERCKVVGIWSFSPWLNVEVLHRLATSARCLQSQVRNIPLEVGSSRNRKSQGRTSRRLRYAKFWLLGCYALISIVARRALADAQRAQEEAESGRKFVEEELAQTQQQIADLESRLEDENREITDVELLRRRLTEELEDERDSHQKELAERDFKLEQTRQKYQGPYSPPDALYLIDPSLQPSCFRSQKVRGWPSMFAYL